MAALRGVDYKADADLAISIKKATSIEETAPKRKHVRSCIVYTWDHRSSAAFWSSLKIQPILADEIQTFKALITVHRILQEGHPSALREAQNQTSWLETCARSTQGEGSRGYGPLIREYVDFLLSKLRFHRNHPEFNGTFEYAEYISLKTIDDPNEGYETISDLMNLQDQINSFQRLIFSHFRSGSSNECRISSLVGLVHESYGIYKFITSMLRAMHKTTNSDEALEPLRIRYEAQHHRLVKFYYECANLRYLTSLISVPKLPIDPPDLFKDDGDDDDSAPSLPRRPGGDSALETPVSVSPEPTPAADTSNDLVYAQELARQQQEYEEEQRRLAAQREAEIYQQQQLAQQQQQQFEDQQRAIAEQQRLAQEQLLRDQLQSQAQGRAAELERDILALRGQYDQDQLMLERYDGRVKALENEIQQLSSTNALQLQSKDDQIKSLQEQLAAWKLKYSKLAEVYTLLRTKYLISFKDMQLKAASAQEAIEKKEKLERELKAKNLDLADLIRERDKAKLELDRVRGGKSDEADKLRRELDDLNSKLNLAEKERGTELSSLLARHNRELEELERQLHNKQIALDELSDRVQGFDGESERLLREKEEELEVYKAGLDEALLKLNELTLNQKDSDAAIDGQIDGILLEHLGKLSSIIDAVLKSSAQRIQDAVFELDSPMQAGNQNSSPSYLLSMIEKGATAATDFATAFNNFIADGPNGDHSEVIQTSAVFSSAIADILINAKGLTRLAPDEKRADTIISIARDSAITSEKFFTNLLSDKLVPLSVDQRTDRVISNNMDVQRSLIRLSKLAETFAPQNNINGANGIGNVDIGELVEREMNNAAESVAKAAARLNQLLLKPKNPDLSSFDLKIHEAILAAAVAVTNAVAVLIKAATDSQNEIVAEGRGSSTKTAFYKKHNRWTEGLISAAKAVATSTNVLIETADGVINGNNSLEQLIVASNEVAASTAQLVAASRVKASFMSKTQDRLENASKAVNGACRTLVSKVQAILQERGWGADDEFGEKVDYSKLSAHEFKRREMEQQVEILKLENDLSSARKRLGEIRKVSYRQDE
ncbi:ANTH domain-containing protein [Lipomyces japonicus]|uniref:ANTH domain-containing protein n=1 Tax=Lipomyces japonicus TaxID=56871 RepID=UPI0034CE5CB3